MPNIIKYAPFAFFIILNVLAIVTGFRLNTLRPFILIITALTCVNLILAIKLKVKGHFLYALTFVFLLCTGFVLLFPKQGQIYIENIIATMYLALFLGAAIPPIFKIKPFTYEFSAKDFPKTITDGQQFLRINLILNYFWAILFIAAFILTIIKYHDNDVVNIIISTLLPIVLLLVVGIPVTKYSPEFLRQIVKAKPIEFRSVKDLFNCMPYGLNKKVAGDTDAIIQFCLTGAEPTEVYLTIKNGICTSTFEKHSAPTTVIYCDSELWLDISNDKIGGDTALINKQYTVEGDASVMLNFGEMFAPPKKKIKQKVEYLDYDFKAFYPHKIKNIVVFNGGARKPEYSKTSFMVKHFLNGAKEAGATIEYFNLIDCNIKNCVGCFTCWTKTPGVCVFKDDMPQLLEKYRNADLVVFASPLFVFSVTGIMKLFMDRLIPCMRPYMLIDEQGIVKHPDRFPEKGKHGFVVFSAAGFPDINHNFDGLTSLYRNLDAHSENFHLMGEFLLPAAEILSQPVYSKRKEKIEDICYKAGIQIIKKGKIEKQLMKTIQNPMVTTEVFCRQADAYWKTLDGKQDYFSGTPEIISPKKPL